MNPMCLLDGCLTGIVLYLNPQYESQNKVNLYKKKKIIIKTKLILK